MSTIKNELDNAQDSTNLGRRKLLQALAATGGAAVLGGLKLDLNWEAPFVEISQIAAQAASTTTPATQFYTLEKQYAAAKAREDFLKQAEPTQGGKRTLIDTSTPGKNSPFVTTIQPSTATIGGESANIKRIGSEGSTNNGNVELGVPLLQCYIVGNSGVFTLEITERGDSTFSGVHNAVISTDKSGKKLISLKNVAYGWTAVVLVDVPSGETYEVELMIGKGSEFGGADFLTGGGQGIFAIIGLVKISK